MKPLEMDLSIWDKFEWERPPVGIKYMFFKPPEEVKRYEGTLGFCEVIGVAHKREDMWYFDKDNEDCVGKLPLGMMDAMPVLEAGQVGPEIQVFDDPRANARLYYPLKCFPKGTVNYVVLAQKKAMTFDPDLFVLYCTPRQAEIVLRAMSYSTGEVWESKYMHVVACSWLFVYPFMTGKVNFAITGTTYGQLGRKPFDEEGKILISIPWNWMPTITENLKKMPWTYWEWEKRENYFDMMVNKIGKLTERAVC